MKIRILCLVFFCMFLGNARVLGQASNEIGLPIIFVHGICDIADKFLPAEQDLKSYLQENYASLYQSSLVYVAFYDGTSAKFQIPTSKLAQGQVNSPVATVDPSTRFFLVALDDNTQASYDQFNTVNVASRSIEEKGDELAQIIWAVKTLTGAPRVVVIGHSMGGLDARAYIEGLGASAYTDATDPYFNDIAALVTLDTPHGGTVFANISVLPSSDWLFCAWQPTTDKSEMDPSGSFMSELNYESGEANPLPQGLSITSIKSYWSEPALSLLGWNTDDILSADEQDLGSNLNNQTSNSQSGLNPVKNSFDIVFSTPESFPLECGLDDVLHFLTCVGSVQQTYGLLENAVGEYSPEYWGPFAATGAVQVSPQTRSVSVGKSTSFTATTKSGSPVIWSILEGGAGGTITQAGIYEAPGTVVNPPTKFHIVAFDSGHTDRYGEATVTVTLPTGNGIPTTGSATSINSNSATISGTVNPNGSAGWGYFLWSANPDLPNPSSNCSYSSSGANGCAILTANSTSQAFSANLSGLATSTTYYYRAAFFNSTNSTTQYGAILSFKTHGTVTITGSPTSITSSGATVSGIVNLYGSTGWSYFLWSTDPDMATPSSNCSYTYISSSNGCTAMTVGSTPQAFNYSPGGLASSTTYYFQIGSYNSSNGSSQLGQIQSFTTLATVTTTSKATAILNSSATIGGSVNTNGSAGYSFLVWGTNVGLESSNSNCSYTYISPNNGCPVLTASSAAQAFTNILSGLASNTTYYYRAGFYNTSNSSIQYGPVLSFTTLSTTTTTGGASAITSSSATISGSVNTNGSTGWGYFLWGTNPELANLGTNCNYAGGQGCPSLTASEKMQTFTYDLSNLASNTTYYYRAAFYNTSNSSTQYGPVLSFTTLATSTATGNTSAITSSGATISGSVNTNGSTGWYAFLWDTVPGLANPGSNCGYQNGISCPSLSTSLKTQAFAYGLSGLDSNTTYYYQVEFYNTSNNSTQFGAIQSFKTPATVTTTGVASAINSSSATLSGSVNTNGSTGWYGFLWSTDPGMANPSSNCIYAYGVCPGLTGVSKTQAFTYNLSSLASNTTYYYQVEFQNTSNNSTQYGAIQSFKTPATVTTTGGATAILNASATISGSVNTNGSAGWYAFLWSTDPGMANPGSNCNYAYSPPCPALTGVSKTQAFTYGVSGLASNTTYYYQLEFYNTSNNSTQYGAILSFNTLATTAISLYPLSLNLGTVTAGSASNAEIATLTNTGTATLGITGIVLTGANPSSFLTSNNCGSSVAAGASCTISVKFDPAVAGTYAASVTVTDSASGSPQSIALAGTGNGPVVLLSATKLTFPDQGVNTQSAAQTVTLTNIGGAPLTVASIKLTGKNAAEFRSSNNCGASLAAGAYCTISVSFYPTATGAATAFVTLTDNAVGSPQSIALSGAGQ